MIIQKRNYKNDSFVNFSMSTKSAQESQRYWVNIESNSLNVLMTLEKLKKAQAALYTTPCLTSAATLTPISLICTVRSQQMKAIPAV